jgi:response regulator RpfG family c-di-GMP phosphodiesterase
MDKKYKVLVVDDEPDNLALLYRTLRHDYDVVKCLSPLEALKILDEEKFQVIISDHKMPDMDGVEFLKLSQEKAPLAIRLLVTAYSDVKILINAINYAKIYRYIKKPYQPDELLYIVQSSLEFYQLKVDNENLIFDLRDLFAGTIKSIPEALAAKDSFTLGKSRRVTFYAIKIAQNLNLSNAAIGKIELAGLLHDIGMIGVPEDILNKTDKLTPEEYEEVKKHVFHSIKILEDIKQLKDVIEIVKYHHEHYDGKGYPYGLKGEEIPIGSRIIALADAWESLRSDRTYRKRMPEEEAFKIIEEQSGTQFDPKLVEILEYIIPQVREEIEEYEKIMKEEAQNIAKNG